MRRIPLLNVTSKEPNKVLFQDRLKHTYEDQMYSLQIQPNIDK